MKKTTDFKIGDRVRDDRYGDGEIITGAASGTQPCERINFCIVRLDKTPMNPRICHKENLSIITDDIVLEEKKS